MNEEITSTTVSSTKPIGVIQSIGVIRNPLVVLILMIVTLGIYSIVWHYCIFEEFRNWRKQGWSGVVFILLLLLGIGTLVAPWLIPAYVGRMYEEDGKEKPITGFTGFWILLPLIGGIVWLFKIQNNLNAFWEEKKSLKKKSLRQGV